jgi:VCBS repeat-containing protein
VTTIDGTPQVVTITIHGANDPALISGTTTGSVTEAAGCKPGTPTATGTLTDTDVDNPPNTFTAVCTPKASTGGYGTFTMTAAGAWTYSLDNSNSAVQALNVCDKLTDTFTVTTIDGTPQVVTITIHGANDPAVISGTTTGSVTEPSCEVPGKPIASGTLTDTDVDNPPNTFTAVCSPTCTTHGFGTFTMTAAGVWTYSLDEDNCAVQALKACDTLTDTFTVTTIDGTPQVVMITIHGAGFQGVDSLAAATQADAPPSEGTLQQDAAPGESNGSQAPQAVVSSDPTSGSSQVDGIGDSSGNPTTVGKGGEEPGREAVTGHDAPDTSGGGYWANHFGGNNDGFVFSAAADLSAANDHSIASIQAAGTDHSDPAPSLLGSHPSAALGAEDAFYFKHEIPDSTGLGAIEIAGQTHAPSSINDAANTAAHDGLQRAQTVEPVVSGHDSADILIAASSLEASIRATPHHDLML